MMPSMIFLRIHSLPQTRFALWLPVFLLWPFGILALFIIVPLLLLADLILVLCGIPMNLVKILFGVMTVIFSLRGMKIDIESPKKQAKVYVRIL